MAESQPVRSFVAGALARGMSKQDVRQLLLQAGWPKDVVEDYLGKVTLQEPSVRASVLQCRGVTKRGRKGTILADVELEVGKGELFGIVGAGGSGKSTLMHILAGALAPDAGDVKLLIEGASVSVSRDASARRHIGFSPQQPSLYDDLTAFENLVHFGALYGLSEKNQKSTALSLLKTVGLVGQQDMLVRDLSAGQRKVLDITCALVHEPAVLMLDDPATELDPAQQRQLWAMLGAVARKGTAVIIASNFLADIEEACDRIGILRNGRIAEIGRPDDLRVVYSHDFEIRVRTESEDYAQLAQQLTATAAKKIRKEGHHLIVHSPDPAECLRVMLAVLGKAKIVSIEVKRPTIQEVFES